MTQYGKKRGRERPSRQSKITRFNSGGANDILHGVGIILLVLFAVCTVAGLCRVSYKMGYNHKLDEEYNLMYYQIRNSAYHNGYEDGSNEIGVEGIARKTELIDAYKSLIEYEDLSDTTRKSYTDRLSRLLNGTLPREEDVERFIKGVNKIISSDDT